VKETNRDQNKLNKIPAEKFSQQDKFIVINSQCEDSYQYMNIFVKTLTPTEPIVTL
jgi:hypothetical protein